MTKLKNLVNITTGKLDVNASVKNGKYPFFTCSRAPYYINDFAFDKEAVLVAGNGELNVKYYNGKFNAYQRTYVIDSRDINKLSNRYLYYFMMQKIEELRNLSRGGVIKYIKLANLTDLEIKALSLEKQKKIVHYLDTINMAIENRKATIIDLDNLVNSRFVEMFGNPSKNDKGWKLNKLENVTSNIENGTSFICENTSREGLFPAMLKLSAVTYGEYREEENKQLIDREQFNIRNEVHNGDLLFTRKNTPELVGMCAYVYNTTANLVMPDLIFRIVTTEKCNKIYLWKLINHKLFRDNIQRISNGSARSMSNISKQNLKKLQIPIPPIELQNTFADFVQHIEKLKINTNNDILELELLLKTRMQEYFG